MLRGCRAFHYLFCGTRMSGQLLTPFIDLKPRDHGFEGLYSSSMFRDDMFGITDIQPNSRSLRSHTSLSSPRLGLLDPGHTLLLERGLLRRGSTGSYHNINRDDRSEYRSTMLLGIYPCSLKH